MKRLIFITSMLIAPAVHCFAQRPDSLAMLRLFMKVCNNYKQLPVQVDIDITNTSNFITDAADSSHIQAKFVLRKEGSYIGLGEAEQIANDSLLLLVNSRLKRMLVYSHRRSVSEQLQLSMGWQLKDSSLVRLAAKYTTVMTSLAKDTAAIDITGRTLVRHTMVPAETVRVRYDPVNFQPYEIRQVTRSLLPVTEARYRLLLSQGQAEGSALIHSDSSYYIVREKVSVYRYDRITHGEGDALPVIIEDRITRDDNGGYKPVSKYASFSLTREF